MTYLEQKVGLPIKERHFFTAERSEQTLNSRKKLYVDLQNQNFNVDVRTFKGKKAYCPNK